MSLDLLSAGGLPPLPTAFLRGEAIDLLVPLCFQDVEAVPAPSSLDRTKLAAALEVSNTAYGHPGAEALSAKLADPATRVVVTGQQPGLLGGPLYTLSKAVAATLWAERLEEAGSSALAVFWVATEDHDFREVSKTHVLAPGGPASFDLGEDRSPLLPVGMRTLGEPVNGVLEGLRQAVPGERYSQWVDRLATWYRPDTRLGEAFCRLLVELLGKRCPLLLDAMLPAVKTAQQPWLERFVDRRVELEEAFVAREEAIEARGFSLQVSPQRGASPLFVLHGRQRRRVEWRSGDRFALRGREPFEESVEWLRELIAENPAVVSAGVMGRSALQDAILGTSILLLGPGEVSYIPQVAPAYDVLGVAPPAVVLRPQALVLARHQVDKLAALGLDLDRLLSPEFDIDAFLAQSQVDDIVTPVREAIIGQLADLEPKALAIDGNLAKPLEKTRAQIEKSLAAFSGRLTSTLARRDEVTRSRLEDLLATCRPGGTLQERVVSTAHFPGKFGAELTEAFFSQLALDPGRLHVIIPGENS